MRLAGRVRKLERSAECNRIPWHELAAHISRQMASSLTDQGEFIPTPSTLLPYRDNLLYVTPEEYQERCVYAGN